MPRTKPSAVKYVKAAKGAARGAKRPPKSYKAFSAQPNYGVRAYERVQQPPLNDQAVMLTALSVRTLLPILPDGAWGGQVYASLSLFPRAAAMAQLFQEYRMTRLDYLLQPVANVAGATGVVDIGTAPAHSYVSASAASMPYLQGLKWLNAPKIAADVTDQFMSEVGVTPVMFNRECVITQKPIVNQNIANAALSTGAPTASLAVKQSPWISTVTAGAIPDVTLHWGPIVRIIQQFRPTVDDSTGTVPMPPGYYQVRCTFEFRKPGQYKAAT